MNKIIAYLIFILPVNTLASNVGSIGEISNDIYGVSKFLLKIMSAASIVVGILLLVSAVVQYQTHRKNPKHVPLSHPIAYIILGLIAMALPFADKLIYYFYEHHLDGLRHTNAQSLELITSDTNNLINKNYLPRKDSSKKPYYVDVDSK